MGHLPCCAVVERKRRAAVVALNDALSFLRNPHGVIIAVYAARTDSPGHAAVNAGRQMHGKRPKVILVGRIHEDMRVVKRPFVDERVGTRESPGRAAVVAAPKQALFRFDQRVDALRIRRRDCHADASGLALR